MFLREALSEERTSHLIADVAKALCLDGALVPLRSDMVLFTGMGICIFTNQAFFIIGDKLAGPVISSAWQCSQPIFTLSISLVLGWEGASLLKTLGIAVSFLGGAFMICYGQPLHSPGFAGNILLLLNCLGTSLYVILGKFAMDRYPSLSITAWSYINASVMMAIAAGSLNTQCWFIEFVCPPDVGSTAQCGKKPTSCTAWSVPPEAVLPLVYWILFNSMAAYFLITWANRYARAGFVLAYTALQPFTSTVLTAALVVSGRFPSLSLPGWNALGGLGVVAGMLCILWDGKRQHEHDTAGHEREVMEIRPAHHGRAPKVYRLRAGQVQAKVQRLLDEA